MSADKNPNVFATKYRALLKDFVASLGGDNITSARRALAEQLATSQAMLSMMTSRFASSDRAGSAEDLTQFLKLSNATMDLMKAAGLGPALEKPIVEQRSDNDPLEKLVEHFNRVVAGTRLEKAAGIFRGDGGAVITCEKRIELERQIFALEQRRSGATVVDEADTNAPPPRKPLLLAAPEPVAATPPTAPSSTPAASTPAASTPAASTPAPTLKATTPKAPTLLSPAAKAEAAEAARHRAMQPMFPAPVSSEPSTTELFYEHSATARPRWGPV